MRDSAGVRLDSFRVADRSGVYAAAALGGGQVASNRIVGPVSSLTNTMVSCRVARLMVNGGSAIRLVYANIAKSGTGEDANNSPIHVKAAVEYPLGSILPVVFGGKQTATIAAGGLIISDPVAVMVEPGDTFYERVTASPPLPPAVTAAGFTTGGNLPAATYFYKVTAVTDGGQSNASTEVSVTTTGTTGRVILTIGDKNMAGVTVLRYNVYRATSSGAELLIGSTAGNTRTFIDDNSLTTPSTTLTATATASRSLTVASTAGFRPGDLVTIGGTDFTVDLVGGDTNLQTTTNVTASSGATATLKVQPPSAAAVLPLNALLYTVDANEGYLNGFDLAWNAHATNMATGAAKIQGVIAAAVLAQPAGNRIPTAYKPPVAVLGDSIANGTGWTATTAPYRGFASYALGERFPYINISTAGEAAYQLADPLHSNVRMTLLQHVRYSISEYGTNDLGRTDAQIKASIVAIAQRAIKAGVLKHWQTTIIPKNASTDGWQTLASQSTGSSETQRQTINKWLRAPASAGAGNSFLADVGSGYVSYVGIFDTALPLERNADGSQVAIGADGAISNGVGGRWKVYGTTQYDTNTGTISGTTTTVADSAKAWTVNQYAGYMLAVTTSGTTTYVQIASNTATTLTVNGTIPAPSGTSTYFIYKGPTIDGTHPTDFTHKDMAAAIDTTQFV